MHKKILLLYLFLLPWAAAAQDEIRTAVGDTVMRKVLRIERYEFFNTKPQLILEKSGEYILPRKVPFTYMKSIRFSDGCEVFFNDKGLVFDQTRNIRVVKASRGALYLEGVYKMNKPELQMLVGEEAYRKQIRPYRILYDAGEVFAYGGIALCLPWLGTKALDLVTPADKKPTSTPGQIKFSTANTLAIVGVACVAAGTTMCIIGHSGCQRFARSFTEGGMHFTGSGLTYRF